MLDRIVSSFPKSPDTILVYVFGLALIPLSYLYKFRKDVKNRLNEIETHSSNFKLIRDKNNERKKRIRCLELDSEFVEKNKDKWQLMSFGQYMSQLHPSNDDYNNFLKKELELTIAQIMLKALGKTLGSAMLPVLGTSSVELGLSRIASTLAAYFAKHILSDEQNAEVTKDFGGIDITFSELVASLSINQRNICAGVSDVTPLDLFRMGEVGYGDLSFHNDKKHENGFPNPFVIERDYNKFITDMEEEYREKNSNYESDDKSYPPPTPINERIFPDLYLGPGDAKCTHTKKECIENRLFSFLLSRLSYNYYKKMNGDVDLFEVHWNGKKCRFPEDLIQACMDNNHKVEVCPKATVAVFGCLLCVKEEDGSFTNIPTCCSMHSGVERSSDGSPAYSVAPHGGMEINITGPLIGKSNDCAVQFYISVAGVAFFYANEDVDLPFLERKPLSTIYSDAEAVSATRMAGMVAYVYNSIGTDRNLPFGGYGVMGLCNDTSAIIDYAIRGETFVYPILVTGRCLNHIFDRLLDLKAGLENDPEMNKVIKDVDKLIKASVEMPNDLQVCPSTICNTAERFCASFAKCTFQMTKDSEAIMMDMAGKLKKVN